VTRYLQSMLFEVKPIDVMTFLGVAVVLALVVLIACLIPARRATKINPLEALR
jgi:ABC-type lipoprotein release transport system permease subunit